MYDKIFEYLNFHMIGQSRIKPEISRFLVDCLNGNNYNFLFIGPSGYGKTHLIKIIYNILGAKNSVEYLPNNVKFDERFRIQIIDEVHELETPEIYYPLLDSKKYIFLFGTNLPGLLKEPLSNRCMVFYLENYTDKELGIIIKNEIKLNIPDEFYTILGSVSRGNPRVSKIIGTRFKLLTREIGIPNSTVELWNRLEELYIDKNGFTDKDFVYLNFLKNTGRASLNTISTVTKLDQNLIKNEIEPFLISKGLIQITPRGRIYYA